MLPRTMIGGCLAIVMLSSTMTPGQDQPKLDRIEELVLGDRYVVEVNRNEVKQRYEGELLKATEEWVVLRQRREARHETGVPIASKLPYAKRVFTNVGIGRWSEQLWIPRAVATIQGRTHSSEQNPIEPLEANAPPLQTECVIEGADPRKTQRGTLTALTTRELSVSRTVVTAERVAVPYVGDLPLIGRAFSKVKEVPSRIDSHVALDDVFCIRCTEHQAASQLDSLGDGER